MVKTMEKLFDRQIRLFGTDVQEKLGHKRIILTGNANNTSTEILKNLVLLGVKEIITTREIVEKTSSIIKQKIDEINMNVKINVMSKSKIKETYFAKKETFLSKLCNTFKLYMGKKAEIEDTFVFLVDKNANPDADFYFICTACNTLHLNTCHDECKQVHKNTVSNACLQTTEELYIGSIAVQEFVKIIKDGKDEAIKHFSAYGGEIYDAIQK